MKRILLIAGGLLLGSSLFAQEPSVETLENLIFQWVKLRKEITLEKERWREQKINLKREKELLLKEKKVLTEEIVKLKKEKERREKERKDLVQKKEDLEKQIEDCLPSLKEAEKFLKRWQAVLPPFLLTSLRKPLLQISSPEEENFSRRLQTVLTILGEIERISSGIHYGKQILITPDNKKREMEVIYLGLSQGFAVSSDDKLGGVGRIKDGKWVWEWEEGLAPRIREAIKYYEKEKLPHLV
ncbi:DUF3450 family protein, partial [Candidatus Calescamantes bacterium]|nr:DUF3450 family protein [Candidatus Calescamantes bacterium]